MNKRDSCTTRYLLAEDYFETIHVFEQQANFGGVWNYSNDAPGRIDIPQTNPNQPLEEPIWHSNVPGNSATHSSPQATFVSPIYERLETNIPHCIMKFSDMPSLEMNQLFPSREAVTQYLENYAEGVKHLVKFQTQVTDIRRTLLRRPYDWLVQTKDLRTSIISDRFYSAIVVANGHYTVPSLPNIRGIKDWDQANKGVISHSKSYRRPEPFANKKVLIVGNSASGTDIASQIAKLSKHPMLISQRSESPMAFAASYKENVPEIAEFLAPAQGRAVRFVDGRVERNIDAILFATGYYYSFPFLSSLEPKLISTGERVQHLYKHMFYIDDPTIAFIGLPSKIIPFRTFESQAAVIARIWSDRLELPSRVEMRKWEEVVIAERGTGKPFHMLPFVRALKRLEVP